MATATIYAEQWTTLKEKESAWQYASISQSDTELCTLAVSTTYSDGIVIFYVHAGMKDKQMLLEIFDKATKHIDSAPSDNIVDYTSTYVYNLRNQGTLKAKDFETDSISYTSSGFPCSKSYLYLASYIDKAAADMLKKLSN